MSRTKNKKKEKMGVTLPIVLGIVWGILIVSLAYGLYKINTPHKMYMPKTKYMIEDLARKDYGAYYNETYNLIYGGFDEEVNTEYREILEVKRYMESMVQYKLYKETGDSDQASYYYKRANQAKEKCGGLGFALDNFDERLHLTE